MPKIPFDKALFVLLAMLPVALALRPTTYGESRGVLDIHVFSARA